MAAPIRQNVRVREPGTADMKILVAVDFGTTFSGLAFVLVQGKKPRSEEVIQEWGRGLETGEKVPTVLKYEEDGTGSYRWGFQVEDEEDDRREWFKLGLYPRVHESDLARRYQGNTNWLQVDSDECEKMVVDYLTGLRKHVDRYLEEHFGEVFWRTTPREYIITVPAVWPDKAQNTTRLCAEKAGMGAKRNIQIVSEPEAAGIYALASMPNIDLKRGDTFVVCDAGGGTVDLVSYTVTSLKPVPAIDEAAAGSGAICGSTYLNRIFAQHLKNKFRDYREWDDECQTEALKAFENDVKRKYVGDNNQTYTVPARGLPDNANLGINKKRLKITGRELREIFEPIMEEIVKLVKAQIRATEQKVKAVLLAGGFGRNEYLLARLQEEVGAEIAVRKVQNSNTSIVRGALIRGLAKVDHTIPSIRLNSRIARKHFGTIAWAVFDEKIHDMNSSRVYLAFEKCVGFVANDANREPDPLNGQLRIEVMKWFVEKGTSVKESVSIPFGFYVDRRVEDGPLEPMDIDVYVCEGPDNSGPPLYRTSDVVKHSELRADLVSIPTTRLHQERGQDGQMYYRVDFDIMMTLESASLAFDLFYAGKKYEAVRVAFV